jgi:hypothetical protein
MSKIKNFLKQIYFNKRTAEIYLKPKKIEGSIFMGSKDEMIIIEGEEKIPCFYIDMYDGTEIINFEEQLKKAFQENKNNKQEYILTKSYFKFNEMHQEKLKFEIIINII